MPPSARSPAGPTKSNPLSLSLAILARILGATLAASFGLVLWDLVSRTPVQIARAIASGVRTPGAALVGALRLIVGVVFAVLALALVLSLPLDGERSFALLATVVFLTGLTVDALVGDLVRAGIGL